MGRRQPHGRDKTGVGSLYRPAPYPTFPDGRTVRRRLLYRHSEPSISQLFGPAPRASAGPPPITSQGGPAADPRDRELLDDAITVGPVPEGRGVLQPMLTSSSSHESARDRDTRSRVSPFVIHFAGLQVPPIHGVSNERSASEALAWGIRNWPELLALRRAANASRFSRFTFEIGRVITSAHVAFAAALQAKQCPDLAAATLSVGLSLQYYRILRYVILQHMAALRRAWHLTDEQCVKLQSTLSSMVGLVQRNQGPHTWQEQRRPADWEPIFAKYIDGRQPQPGSERISVPTNSGPPAGAGREPPEGPHPRCDKFEHLIP
jgi:hypothetical protein